MPNLEVIQAIRGMGEVPPEVSWHFQYLQARFQDLLSTYGYTEIRLPLLERTELFKRGIGESTDIIEKEMYTFVDRGGDSVSLRPEGTAGCVRAAIEHGLLYHQIQKLFYMGPMFRYERPQKGRLRQFHQLGAEAFGFVGPEVDAEILAMTARFFKNLGILSEVELQINTLGLPEERASYRNALVQYFEKHQSHLDEDSQRRLLTNPLRILDSKNPALAELIAKAPKMLEFLGKESRQYFEGVKQSLDTLKIPYRVVSTLVRGLDYYTHLVFEWVSTDLGSQGTVCAGGRYDRLVEEFGGESTPGIGFAMGLERLVLLLNVKNQFPPAKNIDIYVVVLNDSLFNHALKLSERLRDAHPELKMMLNTQGGGAKNQFKRADKSGAKLALILGEEEVGRSEVLIKFLREAEQAQCSVKITELSAWLEKNLGVEE